MAYLGSAGTTPTPDAERNLAGRPIDPDLDEVESPEPGKDYGLTYADDPTTYCYWRRTATSTDRTDLPRTVHGVETGDPAEGDDDGTVAGFLIATFGDAQAVYDPGGRTCTIDDFVVAPGRWPATGAKLLRTAISDAAARSAIQAVVVTANLDEPKREALRCFGLSIASEWWVTSWPPKAAEADATQPESRH